jgi:hypothetical protein
VADAERPGSNLESSWFAIIPDRPLSDPERREVEQSVTRIVSRRSTLTCAFSGEIAYVGSDDAEQLAYIAPLIADQLGSQFGGRLTFRADERGFGPHPLAGSPARSDEDAAPDDAASRSGPLCPSCNRVLVREAIPCPDGIAMCLVQHIREHCIICGWPDAEPPTRRRPGRGSLRVPAEIADAEGPGYVVITYWPDERTELVAEALRQAGLSAAEAAAEIADVQQGGMIYLTFPSVGAARRLANAVARLGGLTEFGQVTP